MRLHDRATASPGSEGNPDNAQGRGGRGWGPFSGGQLTVIILTFAVLLLFPIGAWAVSGSNTFVTDATSGQHATVNGDGSLSATVASPKNFFVRSTPASSSSFKRIMAAPSGHALVVTSIAFDVYIASLTGIGDQIEVAVSKTDNTCSHTVSDPASFLPAFDLNPAGIGDVVVPFQPGLVVPANRALCLLNADTGHISAEVYAYGYQIPAGAAAAGAVALPGAATPNARTQQRSGISACRRAPQRRATASGIQVRSREGARYSDARASYCLTRRRVSSAPTSAASAYAAASAARITHSTLYW